MQIKPISSHRRREIAFADNTEVVCFFTGETLPVETATVEHLVGKSNSMRLNHEAFNLVPSEERINGIVDIAPLSVKFALKKALGDIIMFPKLNKAQRISMYRKAAKSFIASYKHKGVYPWAWKRHVFKVKVTEAQRVKIRKEVKEIYMKLLTPEEIRLGAYVR